MEHRRPAPSARSVMILAVWPLLFVGLILALPAPVLAAGAEPTVALGSEPLAPAQLTGHVPVTNAVGVAVTATITAGFSVELNAATVTSRTFAAHTSFGGLLTGTVSASGDTITLDPNRDFFAGERVQVIATAGISSTGGAALAPVQWGFMAGPVKERCLAGFVEQSSAQLGVTFPGVYFSSVAWGDYDNDGDLDVLLTGYNGSYLTKVYRNNGGSFVDSGVSLPGVSNSSVAWGDYDNDGDLDILLTGWTGGSGLALVYRNNGGNFVNVPVSIPAVYSGSVAWGDYDNDGDLDILLTGYNGSYLAKVYRNNSGSFVDSGATLQGVSNSSVAWGDYDNDGDLDILLTGWTGGSAVALVYSNSGGSFSNSGISFPGVYNSSVAWGDYDNDGDLDILLTGWTGGNSLTLLYRNSGGSFSNSGISLPNVSGSSVAWGDYDNDGDLDILLTGWTGSSRAASIYRNSGGSFTNSAISLPGVDASSVAWGDYDSDGDLDILLTGTTNGGIGGAVTKLFRNNDCTGLRLAKSASTALILPGGAITYTLHYTSYGPGITTGVVISDRVPVSVTVTGVTSSTMGSGASITQTSDGTNFGWRVSDLPANAKGVITVTGIVSNGLPVGHVITNTATITAPTDPAGAIISASVGVRISPFRLTGRMPVTNAVGVAVTSSVTASFEIELNATTVTSRTFAAHTSFGGLLTGTLSASGDAITLEPNRNFFAGERVQVIATAGISSTAGAAPARRWRPSSGALRPGR
ncbi:MAG: VCBS repeat-containing protein [Caldilineaceae bacterium]|nr:VCBS repeat-containing protein [Caldilineaceae bacterium]